jgi:hypothetical protein
MRWGKIVGLAMGVLGSIIACNVVVNPAGEVDNLIKNPSFEKDGKATLAGWKGEKGLNPKILKDAPKDGGNYCVSLAAEWMAPSHKTFVYSIAEHPGRHVYLFAFYGKMHGIPGSAQLLVEQPDSTVRVECSVSVSDTVWTHYAVRDTVTLKDGEKLFVNLTGGRTEVAAGKSEFDLISLTRIAN